MLARRNNRKAIPVLIDNLSHSNRQIRIQSTQILRGWTRMNFGFDPYQEPRTQTSKIDKWRSWSVHQSLDARLVEDFRLEVLPEDMSHGLLVHYSFDQFAIGKFQNLIDQRYSGLTRNSVDTIGRAMAKRFGFMVRATMGVAAVML